MGFFDNQKKENGGYIFLSHSHADIETVRKIRNRLEEEGLEPLCFFLKCLSDESEIEDLIKREIDAREWFVFADSENSRNSRWVTLEREYINRTNSKKILSIDLTDEKSIEAVVQKIIHNLHVFISYQAKDVFLAREITKKLREKDYLVISPEDIVEAGSSYSSIITNAVTEASKDGLVILLLTADALNSKYVEYEINMAVQCGGNILPIIVGNVQLSCEMQYVLEPYPKYKLSEKPDEAEIDTLIDSIGRYIVGK